MLQQQLTYKSLLSMRLLGDPLLPGTYRFTLASSNSYALATPSHSRPDEHRACISMY